MTDDEREIITATVWKKLKLLYAEDREKIVQDVIDDTDGHWRRLGNVGPTNVPKCFTGEVPLGVECDAVAGGLTTYNAFPPARYYFIEGVRSFNRPGEIWIDHISWGGRIFEGFDSATYLLDHGAFRDIPHHRHLAYYRAPWGTISEESPLSITFRGKLPGAKLRWSLYGISVLTLSAGYPLAGEPSDRCADP